MFYRRFPKFNSGNPHFVFFFVAWRGWSPTVYLRQFCRHSRKKIWFSVLFGHFLLLSEGDDLVMTIIFVCFFAGRTESVWKLGAWHGPTRPPGWVWTSSLLVTAEISSLVSPGMTWRIIYIVDLDQHKECHIFAVSEHESSRWIFSKTAQTWNRRQGLASLSYFKSKKWLAYNAGVRSDIRSIECALRSSRSTWNVQEPGLHMRPTGKEFQLLRSVLALIVVGENGKSTEKLGESREISHPNFPRFSIA